MPKYYAKKVGAKCPLVLQKLGQNVLRAKLSHNVIAIAITKIDSRPKRLLSKNEKLKASYPCYVVILTLVLLCRQFQN